MSKQDLCICGHLKSWHTLSGICIRSQNHGCMSQLPDCNCFKFELLKEPKTEVEA